MIKESKNKINYLNKELILYKIIALTQRDDQCEATTYDLCFKYVFKKFSSDSRIPLSVKSLMKAKIKKEKIESLFNLMINQTRTKNGLYQKSIHLLDNTYEAIRKHLEVQASIQKKSNAHTQLPDIKLFKRSSLLIHFCRTLIPEVANPIFLARISSKKIKDAFYDACTVLVMMNLIIDDVSDKLGWSKLLEQLSQIHHGNHTYKDIYIESREQSKLCFKIFTEAKQLWINALSIINNHCLKKNCSLVLPIAVLDAFDQINRGMTYSIKINKKELPNASWSEGFDKTLEKLCSGMMIHAFYELGNAILETHTNLNLTSTTRKYLENTKYQVLSAGRLAHDIASLVREIIEGDRTNTILHLLQDKLKTSQNPNQLSDLLDINETEAGSSILVSKQIYELLIEYKIWDDIFDKWNTKVSSIYKEGEFRTCFEGSINLLLMYLLMMHAGNDGV